MQSNDSQRERHTMAGNIVKWWKHKILGGYKQFSGENTENLSIYMKNTECYHIDSSSNSMVGFFRN